MIKRYVKFLPLFLAISASTSFAQDIDIDRKKSNAELNFHDLRKNLNNTENIYNKNAFVNLEIQDLVITDVKLPFESISTTAKSLKNSDELDTYLNTLGKVQSTSMFNFASVPTDSDKLFENSSTNRHLVKNEKESKKKDENPLNSANGENSNSYMFNISLKRMFDERFEINLNGLFDTDYIAAGQSTKNENNLERTQVHRVFKQTSAVNINEYSIISYDVKSTGAANDIRESRFVIVKVTGTESKSN